MTTYILRRIIQSAVVVLITTLILFLINRIMPGDPILAYISSDDYVRITSIEQMDALRAKYGLDKPLIVQYYTWMERIILHGDFGRSIFWDTTVLQELKRALPISLTFGAISWIISHTIGILLGTMTAIRRGKWADTLITTLGNLMITIPGFWAAILMIYVFGLWLNVLPIQGWVAPWVDFWGSLRYMVMPLFCVAILPAGGSIRQTRSTMLEVIRQDYVRTAWAKGLSERRIIFYHVLKNGLLPVVTLIGMSIPQIFGGQILIETIFNIPGMGRLATAATFAYDYNIMQGLSLIMCTVVIVSNLVVDVLYGWLDPRIHYE